MQKHCPIHGNTMSAKITQYGDRWQCSADGCTVACWDGSTSTPADAETRTLRTKCHAVFDALWKNKRFPSRKEAYRWLRDSMGLTNRTAHIGMMDKAQCERLLVLVEELNAGVGP